MSTVTKDYGQYTYADERLEVKIVIKAIEERRGNADAHVHITATAPDGELYDLYKARTGISAYTARKRLAVEVKELLDGDEKNGEIGLKSEFGISSPIVTNDWKSTINRAMEDILDAHHAGTPPVNLYEDPTAEEEEAWRIPGLLAEDLNILYGQSGTGKSYLALILGQAIHHGVPVCSLGTIKGNVLMLDYETTKGKMVKRLHRVDEGLGLTGSPMLYIAATVPVALMVESLQEYITQHSIDFLIIDSLARASGGSITDDEAVRQTFEAIRQLDRPSLLIHHTNRGDDYYGSAFIRAWARNLWRLRSVTTEGSTKLSIQLKQEKENDGPGIGSLGFALEFKGDAFDPEAVILTAEDESKMPELRKFAKLWQQIIEMLKEQPEGRMLIEDPTPNTEYKMTGGNIIRSLQLLTDKSKHSTVRSYLWSLREQTAKYKQLAEAVYIDKSGQYICLKNYSGDNEAAEIKVEPIAEPITLQGGIIL